MSRMEEKWVGMSSGVVDAPDCKQIKKEKEKIRDCTVLLVKC